MLLRTLGNAGDGVSSVFPEGKQNEDFEKNICLIEEIHDFTKGNKCALILL
jgi:hypothetical protein